MFGGVGFLMDGNLCVGIWKDSLVARIGPEAYETALRESCFSPFDITGRPMTGWMLVAPKGIAKDAGLRAWWQRSAEFVKTLPAK